MKYTLTIKKINAISGLFYIKDIKINTSNIIKNLDELHWVPLSNNKNSRMVQHYGYKYDYLTKKINVKSNELPNFLLNLQSILTQICINIDICKTTYEFNQCIVNNYYTGQGISKHIDVKSYGEIIGCFSLGSGATMRFTNSINDEKHDIYVEPNSLYIMSGDARYIWTHEMIYAKYDNVDNKIIPRDRRISVTFRNVPI